MALMKSALPGKISIAEAVESLDAAGEFFEFFFDRQTGAVLEVPTEEGLSYIDAKDVPQADRKLWSEIEQDESGKRFVKLPTQFEVHEWDIMRRFVDSLNDETQSRMLHEQIRGGGAFRRFHNAVERIGLLNVWHAYKEKALRDLMMDWCEEHGVQPVD